MSIINTWKIGTAAALAALALGSGCAATTSDADEPLGASDDALVTLIPAGTRLSCSMSSPGVTGRRKAFLIVDYDARTCYRQAEPGFLPAPESTPSCHSIGYGIGCEEIKTLTP
jgi:hypothetical protein